MKDADGKDSIAHRFIQAGVLLFLLGLLTGFAIPLMDIPRMGVASHLEGVLNGMFLIALGLVWNRVALPGWAEKAAVGCALFGTFANWLATLLAALWSAGGMTPVAGGGAVGGAAQEMIVSFLLLSLSFAMLALCVLVLAGLSRARALGSWAVAATEARSV